MSFNEVDRAQVLAEALPYIQKYYGKTIVVKYGGNAMISEELRTAVMSDIILLSLVGVHVVVVHGGGPEISSMLKKVGKESQFVDGLRYTDEETMDVVQDVLCGKVNKNLVAALNRMGGKAMGLCGLDGALFEAKVKNPKYGLVGEITKVNPGIIYNCLENGLHPGGLHRGLRGRRRVLLQHQCGHRRGRTGHRPGFGKPDPAHRRPGPAPDPKDESTLIPLLPIDDVPTLKQDGTISGGMIPKVDCCVRAIQQGVQRTFILDGRIPHSILIEMLTNQGIGTMLL